MEYEHDGRFDDLTRCHVCMDRFGCRYRHLDSDDVKRWNKVPIQSTACTHTLCFPCVEWAVLLGGSTSRTESQQEPAVKCPLCMADKAFTLKGKVNLAACALAKVVEDRGAVQAADCWSVTTASVASVPPPLLVAHYYANPSSGTWGSGAPKSTSYAAGAKRPPVSQGVTQAPSSQPKKKKKKEKKKARIHRSSLPARSMLKPPPPSAADLIDLTRPVRRRTKVQTITEEWNADHERKLAARAMAPDWDVLLASRGGRGGGGVAEAADHSQQASTTADGANGSSDVVTTAGDGSATSTEPDGATNDFGATPDDALHVAAELTSIAASTETPLSVGSECAGVPSTPDFTPNPVDQELPATSPASDAVASNGSCPSTSDPMCESIEMPSIDASAACLVVDRESEVRASPSNVEGRAPATATGTSEVFAPSMLDTKQPPPSNGTLHQGPEDATETVDIEVASVMEVEAPAKDSPSIYSIDDEDEDGADEDSEVISFAECPTSASHDATRPFAEAGEYASTPHIAARRKELAMHRCLNSAFEVCPIPAEESDDGLQVESMENAETSTCAPSNGEEVAVHVPSAPSPLETRSRCIDVSHRTKQLDMETDDGMSVIDLTGDESDDNDSVIDLTMDDDSVDGDCNTIEGLEGSWTVVPV